jgi:hypothetical protein
VWIHNDLSQLGVHSYVVCCQVTGAWREKESALFKPAVSARGQGEAQRGSIAVAGDASKISYSYYQDEATKSFEDLVYE